MNLALNPTDTMHGIRIFVVLFLLGFFQFSFADKTSDLIVEDNRESPIELSVPSEFDGQVADISRPDFSGIWVLDESASDDLNETMKEAQKKGSSSGRGGKGSGGRRGGRGPGGGGVSGENFGEEGMSARSKSGKEGMAELSARRLEIIHQEPLLRITTERHGTRELYTDFRGASISAADGMKQLIVTGGWEGNVLVIESTTANGDRTVQHLRLLEGPLRLERLSMLPGRNGNNQSIQIKQIFVPEGAIIEKTAKGNSVESDHLNWLED